MVSQNLRTPKQENAINKLSAIVIALVTPVQVQATSTQNRTNPHVIDSPF
jgi:hypothetical protein